MKKICLFALQSILFTSSPTSLAFDAKALLQSLPKQTASPSTPLTSKDESLPARLSPDAPAESAAAFVKVPILKIGTSEVPVTKAEPAKSPTSASAAKTSDVKAMTAQSPRCKPQPLPTSQTVPQLHVGVAIWRR